MNSEEKVNKNFFVDKPHIWSYFTCSLTVTSIPNEFLHHIVTICEDVWENGLVI